MHRSDIFVWPFKYRHVCLARPSPLSPHSVFFRTRYYSLQLEWKVENDILQLDCKSLGRYITTGVYIVRLIYRLECTSWGRYITTGLQVFGTIYYNWSVHREIDIYNWSVSLKDDILQLDCKSLGRSITTGTIYYNWNDILQLGRYITT
jgi:hypothetical protein